MKDTRHCSGCRNNFYNGNNDLGVSKCWSLADAKVVWKKEVPIDQVPPWKKEVPIDQVPPWNQKATRVLDCYSRVRYVYVDSNRRF